ncbi:MAG: single-stranded-DNA-specific exonuclease RecJ [Ruminococcus sp.]|nr:single-stranded-DNA-specific exonuclease RecJ [Ruminococcus sp.]
MKKWLINKCDDKAVADFSSKCDIGRLTLEVLSSRGCTGFEQIVDFFQSDEIEEPFAVKDMDKAVGVINKAIDSYELICIYGDYDCDGVTSTSILFNFLLSMGGNVMYHIPERSEGYGMNIPALEMLAEKGVKLIVTVDNGISAIDEAEKIYELGMKLVVTDHHQPGEVLPRAEAVVDPHRSDCGSAYKDLCGAGVALKLCAALDGGSYDTVLEQYCDLCAIGTIQDSVPLNGENRAIVKKGLKLMANTDVIGLSIMMDKMNVDRNNIVSDTVGFKLGPVINASGRFGTPLNAVKALLSEDEEDAESYVDTIIRNNESRKETEAQITREIFEYIDHNGHILDHRVLVLAGRNWHHGVIGIVASRLLEYYSKPVFIISIEESGEARGSARSVKGFNTHTCLTFCKEVLTKFGGHECAGGFSLNEKDIPRFRELIDEFAAKADRPPVAFLTADKLLMPGDITVENVKGLRVLEPTGTDNAKPVFALLGAVVDKLVPMSEGKHTKLFFRYGGVSLQAPLFGVRAEKLGYSPGDRVDMLVNLEINSFGGKESVEARIIDHRLSGVKQERYFAAKDAYEKLMRGERLPSNYVAKMIPSREELVAVYKYIRSVNATTVDNMFMRLSSDSMNYCKLRICIDIFKDKGLIEFRPAYSLVGVLPVQGKTDLEQSDTLIRLRAML